MHKKWFIILCVLSAVVGCRPRGVLSNQQMRDVLYDLHRVDGAIQVAGYHYGHDQEVAAYYMTVLDKHGITQAQFDSSLVWFTDNPQVFNKIYPKVIARLEEDLAYEEELREERLRKYRTKRKATQEVQEEEAAVREDTREKVDKILKTTLYGIENPWKEWKNEEFCKKDVIIFGQLEKK